MKKVAMLLVLTFFSVAILFSPAIAVKDPPGTSRPWIHFPDIPAISDDVGWADPHSPMGHRPPGEWLRRVLLVVDPVFGGMSVYLKSIKPGMVIDDHKGISENTGSGFGASER